MGTPGTQPEAGVRGLKKLQIGGPKDWGRSALTLRSGFLEYTVYKLNRYGKVWVWNVEGDQPEEGSRGAFVEKSHSGEAFQRKK